MTDEAITTRGTFDARIRTLCFITYLVIDWSVERGETTEWFSAKRFGSRRRAGRLLAAHKICYDKTLSGAYDWAS